MTSSQPKTAVEALEHALTLGAGEDGSPDPLLDTVVDGRYQILELLGSGGMGAVYRAEHLALRQNVAIKVLKPELARRSDAVRRFIQEARAAARIDHPAIVQVHDLGVSAELVYIAMEELEGEELRDFLDREGQADIDEAVGLIVELADAISAAHEHGIVHRDLKPANVFLAKGRRGRDLKVLDFGIAKLLETDLPGAPTTRTGQVLGTPQYMSPEQFRGADTGPPADVWAISAILFELLSGVPAFEASTFAALAVEVMTGRAAPLRELRPNVSPELAAVVARGLSNDVEARYPDAGALRDALESLESLESPTSVEPRLVEQPNREPSTDSPARELRERTNASTLEAPASTSTETPVTPATQAPAARGTKGLLWGLAVALVFVSVALAWSSIRGAEAVPVEAVPVEAVPVEAVPVEAVPVEAVPVEVEPAAEAEPLAVDAVEPAPEADAVPPGVVPSLLDGVEPPPSTRRRRTGRTRRSTPTVETQPVPAVEETPRVVPPQNSNPHAPIREFGATP